MAKEPTPKRAAFVREYLVDLNAARAAVRAGYAESCARQTGSDLLTNPVISAAIQAEMDKRAKVTGINAASVLDRLNKLADRCMQAEPVLDKEGNETGEYRFDSAGAARALELIGKHLKLFTDKIEVDASDALADKLAQAQARLTQRQADGEAS